MSFCHYCQRCHSIQLLETDQSSNGDIRYPRRCKNVDLIVCGIESSKKPYTKVVSCADSVKMYAFAFVIYELFVILLLVVIIRTILVPEIILLSA